MLTNCCAKDVRMCVLAACEAKKVVNAVAKVKTAFPRKLEHGTRRACAKTFVMFRNFGGFSRATNF